MSSMFNTKEELEKHIFQDQTEVIVELKLLEGEDIQEVLEGLSRYFAISSSLGNALPSLSELSIINEEPLGSWLKVATHKTDDIINYVYNLLN